MKKSIWMLIAVAVAAFSIWYGFRYQHADSVPASNSALGQVQELYNSLQRQPDNFSFPGCALVHGDDAASQNWPAMDEFKLGSLIDFYIDMDQKHELIRVGNEMWIVSCDCTDLANIHRQAEEVSLHFPWTVFHIFNATRSKEDQSTEPMQKCMPSPEDYG